MIRAAPWLLLLSLSCSKSPTPPAVATDTGISMPTGTGFAFAPQPNPEARRILVVYGDDTDEVARLQVDGRAFARTPAGEWVEIDPAVLKVMSMPHNLGCRR